jgi:transcriptional regulator with AAA-type ATPase domain
LAGWVFQVPSLSERREDILPLAKHFLTTFCPELGVVEFGMAAATWLRSRDYPGNTRDLRQLVLRIGARHVGNGPIGLADIPEDDRPCIATPILPWPDPQFQRAIEHAVSLGIGLKEIGRMASEFAVQAAMRSNGSLRNAARSLGVSDRALQLRHASARHAGVVLN